MVVAIYSLVSLVVVIDRVVYIVVVYKQDCVHGGRYGLVSLYGR